MEIDYQELWADAIGKFIEVESEEKEEQNNDSSYISNASKKISSSSLRTMIKEKSKEKLNTSYMKTIKEKDDLIEKMRKQSTIDKQKLEETLHKIDEFDMIVRTKEQEIRNMERRYEKEIEQYKNEIRQYKEKEKNNSCIREENEKLKKDIEILTKKIDELRENGKGENDTSEAKKKLKEEVDKLLKANSDNLTLIDKIKKEIDDNGFVNMYKIKIDDISGWVYSKYLVDTLEEAKEVYNENGVYDTHKDRKYSRELYGGKASSLDYYPYNKPNFNDNKLLEKANAIYLNGSVIKNVDTYIDLAKNTGINAMVVDIKDGVLAYDSNVAREYSPTAYKNAINSFSDYQNAIKKIKDAGFYVIGRIVVFNDSHYGKDHPEDCIVSSSSSRLWPSAYSRGAWEYNVNLALEAAREMKFNEIQFDYVRFPEDAYKMSTSGGTDFKNKYDEEKAEAIQNFLFYAADQIHKANVYFSVDVFGECSNTYVTAYGQYWPAISNIVDVISAMPYTDHFDNNPVRWNNPYQTMNNWGKTAAARQKEIPTPAIARTWITAYDTPHWNPTVVYDASKIADQIRGLNDAGLNGGVMTWNVRSSVNKYNQIKSAFTND